MMETTKSVQQWCEEAGIDYKQLAERSGLDEQRVLAIVLGRWTPSPSERDRVGRGFRYHARPNLLGPQNADSTHLREWTRLTVSRGPVLAALGRFL